MRGATLAGSGLLLCPLVLGAVLSSSATGQYLEATIKLPDTLGWLSFPWSLVYNPQNNKVYVGCDSGVLVVDGATIQGIIEQGDMGSNVHQIDVGGRYVTPGFFEAFGVGVNELPLSIVLSWYEQKAVAVLQTLLYLGVKNIRIGPSLPAFVSPTVLNVLVEKFGLTPIKTAEEDLKTILG